MKLRLALCPWLLAAGSLAHAAAPSTASVAAPARPAATYPLVVSFISHGSGVPDYAVAPFNVIVNEFEQAYGPAQRIVAPWGREGEYDVCFTLAGLTPDLQQRLIDDLLWLDAEPFTEVAENARCGW